MKPLRRFFSLCALLLAAFPAVILARAETARPLPALGARLEETSVSGLSSGAYMAGQFHLAHSRTIGGAAIIAGGPYACAETFWGTVLSWWPGAAAMFNAPQAFDGCMGGVTGAPDADRLAERARALANAGRIDPVGGVEPDRIYLFSGRNDPVVAAAIVAAAAKVYRNLGVPAANIRHVTGVAAGHGFVTRSDGAACGLTLPPYIVGCDYDQARDLLEHLLGPLNPPGTGKEGEFLVFDQRPFVHGLPAHGLDGEGVAYIPKTCRGTAGCRIHVAFHGCLQGREAAGGVFVEKTGFARWAETNRLIVLFPQVAGSGVNPMGCWDWWGYTGGAFLTRQAPQIAAVYRMLERLAGRSGDER